MPCVPDRSLPPYPRAPNYPCDLYIYRYRVLPLSRQWRSKNRLFFKTIKEERNIECQIKAYQVERELIGVLLERQIRVQGRENNFVPVYILLEYLINYS